MNLNRQGKCERRGERVVFISIFNALESGVIYAIMALGVYLSFRVLDFPDLTVDGSFVTVQQLLHSQLQMVCRLF